MRLLLASLVAVGVALFGVAPAVHAADYDIDFKLNNNLSYGAVQFKVNYASAPGQFSGNNGSVACSVNTSINALAAFNEDSPYLRQAFITPTSFAGPAVLATCVFSSTGGAPTAGQFAITVDDFKASHPTAPPIVISRIALR